MIFYDRAGSGNVVGAAAPGSNGSSATTVNGGGLAHKGPDEEKIKEILERTGYTLDVTTGQRKFGGPPPGWEGEAPSKGCEVSNVFLCHVVSPSVLHNFYVAVVYEFACHILDFIPNFEVQLPAKYWSDFSSNLVRFTPSLC